MGLSIRACPFFGLGFYEVCRNRGGVAWTMPATCTSERPRKSQRHLSTQSLHINDEWNNVNNAVKRQKCVYMVFSIKFERPRLTELLPLRFVRELSGVAFPRRQRAAAAPHCPPVDACFGPSQQICDNQGSLEHGRILSQIQFDPVPDGTLDQPFPLAADQWSM